VSSSYESWIDKFVAILQTQVDDVTFSAKQISGSVVSTDLLESREVDVTITGAHLAYLAYTQGTESMPVAHRNLRGLAVATVSAMHLVAGENTGIKRIEDLKGKRVGVGPVGSGTEFMVRMLLPAFGISLAELDIRRMPFETMPPQLANGGLDAEFVSVGVLSPFAKDALAVSGSRLIAIVGPPVSKLREEYPFFRPVMIPARAYGENADTETIGVDFILICHKDLPDNLVHTMLGIFVDSLPELAQQHPELGTVTLQQSPSVPIPLHPGAAAYRERELLR
jgi:TRAP transporter TAXI family solute receptor